MERPDRFHHILGILDQDRPLANELVTTLRGSGRQASRRLQPRARRQPSARFGARPPPRAARSGIASSAAVAEPQRARSRNRLPARSCRIESAGPAPTGLPTRPAQDPRPLPRPPPPP